MDGKVEGNISGLTLMLKSSKSVSAVQSWDGIVPLLRDPSFNLVSEVTKESCDGIDPVNLVPVSVKTVKCDSKEISTGIDPVAACPSSNAYTSSSKLHDGVRRKLWPLQLHSSVGCIHSLYSLLEDDDFNPNANQTHAKANRCTTRSSSFSKARVYGSFTVQFTAEATLFDDKDVSGLRD